MSAEETPIDPIDLDAAKEAIDAMQNPEVQALLAQMHARGPMTQRRTCYFYFQFSFFF